MHRGHGEPGRYFLLSHGRKEVILAFSYIMSSIGRQKTGKVFDGKNRMVAEKSFQFHRSPLMTLINLTRNYITCNKRICQLYFMLAKLNMTILLITLKIIACYK